MKDSVLSVRIDEKLKQEFVALAAANQINNKELMELLMVQFVLHQSTAHDAQATKEIAELTQLTKRMVDLYTNLVDRHQLKLQAIENEEASVLAQKEEELTQLNEQLVKLSVQGEQLEQLKGENAQLQTQLSQLKQEYDDVKELSHLLRDKNNDLQQELSDAKKALDGVPSLKQLEQTLAMYQERTETLTTENEALVRKVDEQHVIFETELTTQLAFNEKALTLKLEQSLFDQRLLHQDKLEQLRREKGALISTLQQQNNNLVNQLQQTLVADLVETKKN